MSLSNFTQDVKDTIVSVIKGTDDVVTALRVAVKNQVVGSLGDVGEVVSGAILAAAEVGEDVGQAAIAAVSGAIEGAGKLGKDTNEVTKIAAVGAVKTATELGEETGKTVRQALLSAVSLPHDVIESALKGS